MKKLVGFTILWLATFISVGQPPWKDNPGDTLGIWNVYTFEEPTECIHIGTPANLWQIGHPQKTFFNAAWSADRAIVTDTLNPYPTSSHAWFDLYLGGFNFNQYYYPWSTFIDFRHKFDSDSLHDGGYITISWDKGLTWMNAISDTVPMSHAFMNLSWNIYSPADTLYNGEPGFSGRSAGWIQTGLSWNEIHVKKTLEFPPDTLIVRFNFISDNDHHPREGWMIDDIRLYSLELWGSIEENNSGNPALKLGPNPFSDYTFIMLEKAFDEATGVISDLNGRILRTIDLSGISRFRLNRGDLVPGTYLIRINLGNSVHLSRKLLIFD
jgi:hypothetical protein